MKRNEKKNEKKQSATTAIVTNAQTATATNAQTVIVTNAKTAQTATKATASMVNLPSLLLPMLPALLTLVLLSMSLLTVACGGGSSGGSSTSTAAPNPAADPTPVTLTQMSVTAVAGAGTTGTVVLAWTEPTAADYSHVLISWTPTGGTTTQPLQVAKGTTTATIEGLTANAHSFTAITVNTAGARSAASAALAVTGINPPRVLSATTKVDANTMNGPTLAANAFFGNAMANVGNLDGSGGTVIAVGAAGTTGNRGAMHLLFYSSSGVLTKSTAVMNGTTITPATGTTSTLAITSSIFFGGSIANVGDLDGSGPGGTVIAVGAVGDDTGGTDHGAIHLLTYNASGVLTTASKIHSGTTNGPATQPNGQFGASIANVGDLDGGGGTVIAVGADLESFVGADGMLGNNLDMAGLAFAADNSLNSGAIYLLSYNASGSLTATTKVEHGTTNGPTLGQASQENFGSSIANVGDLDGGGGTVIAVGAPGDDTGSTSSANENRGAMYLLSYNASGTLTATTKVAQGTTNGPILTGANQFGSSIAHIGDLDGDGGTVIAVGARTDRTGVDGVLGNSDDTATGAGAIYLLYYSNSGVLTKTLKVTSATTNGPTLAENARFGISIANVGALFGGRGTVLAVGSSNDATRPTGVTSGSFFGAMYLLNYR